MTTIALGLLLIDAFVFSIVLYFLPDLFRPMLSTARMLNWFYFFMYFFDDFIFALIIILLTGAAFSKRELTPADSTT